MGDHREHSSEQRGCHGLHGEGESGSSQSLHRECAEMRHTKGPAVSHREAKGELSDSRAEKL